MAFGGNNPFGPNPIFASKEESTTTPAPQATPEKDTFVNPFGANNIFGPIAEGSKPEASPEGSPEGAAENYPPHPFGLPSIPGGNGHPEPEGEGFPEPEGEGWPRPEGERWPRPEGERWPRPEGERWPRPEGEGWPEAEPGVYPEPEVPLFSDYTGLSVYSTLAAIIATLIIALNIAVLVVLSRRPKQRKSLSFLIGLISTFDMLGGFQFLWFSSFDMHLMLTHRDMWIIVMCGIWMLTMAPQIAAMLHFGLHLLDELSVGVNNAKFSAGRIAFVVLTVFVLPVAIFIPPLAGWNCIGCRTDTNPENYCAKKCSMTIFPFTKIYILLMVLLLFAAMIVVISIYAMIYCKISQKRSDRKLNPKSGNTSVIRVTTLLLFIYILFTLPVSIVMIFDFATWQYNPHLVTAFGATLFVSFLSNLINPIIIFSTLPSMRQTKMADCCRSDGEAGGRSNNLHTLPPENGVNGKQGVEEKHALDEEQDVTKI